MGKNHWVASPSENQQLRVMTVAFVFLPVADLCPPQTGHGFFQVLPQVRDVLHRPHASRLWVLSCGHTFHMIYLSYTHAHTKNSANTQN